MAFGYNYKNAFDLNHKVAFVTGGGRGLGREYAYALGSQGATVVVGDINQDDINATCEQLRNEGIRAEGYFCDVTNQDAVDKTLNSIVEKFGGLHIVVNNAGIVERVGIEDMTLEAWNRTMNINLTGVFLVSKYAARHMIGSHSGGSIINMASMSGIVVNTPMEQAAYNTSKAAVIMLTKSCATEWAPYNIRVNAIAPGYMKTDMTGPDFEPGGQYYDLFKLIPMERLGLPHELGGLAIWLASDNAGYVTGSVVTVDGGYTLW